MHFWFFCFCSNGIYFLKVKNEQFSQTEKIIKK
ncbi:T9SS type A sorting domain-containing protein [Flavobacterium orientale]